MIEWINEWMNERKYEWDGICNNIASSMRAHAPIVNVWMSRLHAEGSWGAELKFNSEKHSSQQFQEIFILIQLIL